MCTKKTNLTVHIIRLLIEQIMALSLLRFPGFFLLGKQPISFIAFGKTFQLNLIHNSSVSAFPKKIIRYLLSEQQMK